MLIREIRVKNHSKNVKKSLTPPLHSEIFVAHTVKLKQKQNMRTKILLAAAAALAAGVMASNAQVYSANVVGYVTVTSAGGAYSLLANPLDNGSNTLASLVTAPTGSHALIWTGTTFTGSTKTPTSWSPNPVVAPGQGFFLQPTGVNPVTNTFVGNVIAAPGGGTVTNSLAGGAYSLVGSPIPFSEALAGTNINLGIPTGSHVLVWNGSTYTGSTKTPTSYSPNPTITPGEGFFVQPTGTSPYQWVQTLH